MQQDALGGRPIDLRQGRERVPGVDQSAAGTGDVGEMLVFQGEAEPDLRGLVVLRRAGGVGHQQEREDEERERAENRARPCRRGRPHWPRFRYCSVK